MKRSSAAALVATALAGASAAAEAQTSFTVSGYVKLDAILSSRSAGVDSVGDQMLVPSLIPVGPNAGAHKTDQVTFHARQSRLSLATSTPTAYGPLAAYIEGDFFGDLPNGNETSTNSQGFRLRHTYGQWPVSPPGRRGPTSSIRSRTRRRWTSAARSVSSSFARRS